MAKDEKLQQYDAEQIQVLEGLEAVRKKTRDVYRQHGPQRTSSSGV